jgi:hypothetical protein
MNKCIFETHKRPLKRRKKKFPIPTLFLTREYHDLRHLALPSNRLAVQIIKESTPTTVKVWAATPRKNNIPSLRILVLSEILFSISTRLHREIKLELEVVGHIPDTIQLIPKKPVAVEMEDDTGCIAVSRACLQEVLSGSLGLICVRTLGGCCV